MELKKINENEVLENRDLTLIDKKNKKAKLLKGTNNHDWTRLKTLAVSFEKTIFETIVFLIDFYLNNRDRK